MGCSISTQYQNILLIPQAQPVAAIDPRHCDPHHCVTLRHKFHRFKGGWMFVDKHTGVTRFKVKSKAFSRRASLLDATTGPDRTPIATFKQKTAFFSKPVILVHAGSNYDGPELFQLHIEYYRGDSTRVQVVFTNVWTHQRCELGFMGNWHCRDGFFWLDRGLTGVREPVAKLIHLMNEVEVDIAPNMDAALIAMLCIILKDEEWRAESSD